MTDLDVLEARLNAHILVRGELASWKPTIFKLIAAARERDAMREALAEAVGAALHQVGHFVLRGALVQGLGLDRGRLRLPAHDDAALQTGLSEGGQAAEAEQEQGQSTQ